MSFDQNKNLLIQILNKLDDSDLAQACQINQETQSLCSKDEFWQDRIEKIFGPNLLDLSSEIPNQEYYFQLRGYPLTQEGINKALREGYPLMREYLTRKSLTLPLKIGYTFPSSLVHQTPPQNVIRVYQNIVDFFNQVNLGEIIIQDPYLRSIPSTRLQNKLYFLHPKILDLPNPLYGIIKFIDLINLFKIYFAYDFEARVWGTKNTYKVSPQMKEYLGNLIESLINHQVQLSIQQHPEDEDTLREIGESLKEAIYDPSIRVNGQGLFDPRRFGPKMLIRLAQQSKVKNEDQLTEEELNKSRWLVHLTYKNFEDEINSIENLEYFGKFGDKESSIEYILAKQSYLIDSALRFIQTKRF